MLCVYILCVERIGPKHQKNKRGNFFLYQQDTRSRAEALMLVFLPNCFLKRFMSTCFEKIRTEHGSGPGTSTDSMCITKKGKTERTAKFQKLQRRLTENEFKKYSWVVSAGRGAVNGSKKTVGWFAQFAELTAQILFIERHLRRI